MVRNQSTGSTELPSGFFLGPNTFERCLAVNQGCDPKEFGCEILRIVCGRQRGAWVEESHEIVNRKNPLGRELEHPTTPKNHAVHRLATPPGVHPPHRTT